MEDKEAREGMKEFLGRLMLSVEKGEVEGFAVVTLYKERNTMGNFLIAPTKDISEMIGRIASYQVELCARHMEARAREAAARRAPPKKSGLILPNS